MLFREKIDFEDIPDTMAVREIALPAAIVFHGGTNVPAHLTVSTKGGAGIRRGVGNDPSTHGSKRSAVEIELPKEGRVSGQ